MHKYRKKITSASLALTLLLSGCSTNNESNTDSITETHAITSTPVSENTKPPITTTYKATTTSPITVETEMVVSSSGIEEEYGIFTLSDEDQDYISELVFVGDSICRGYNVYDFIPDEHNLAKGNLAARSIMDYTYDINGYEMNYLCAIYDKQPRYIVFSMGMNDINMTSKEIFVENYKNILSDAEKYCPNSYLIVLGITPICTNFTSNSEIDIYNKALEDMVADSKSEKLSFINPSDELKNINNELKSLYSGGDGIHLSPDAYKAILWTLCRNKVEYKLGDEKRPSAPDGYKKTTATSSVTTEPPMTTIKPQTTAPQTTAKPAATTKKTTPPEAVSEPLPDITSEKSNESEPEETIATTENTTEQIKSEETTAPDETTTTIETTYLELPVD